jgi:hypothetical protein
MMVSQLNPYVPLGTGLRRNFVSILIRMLLSSFFARPAYGTFYETIML